MPSLDELKAAFKAFDKDGNGTLDAQELVGILMRKGSPLSLDEANSLVKVCMYTLGCQDRGSP